MDVARGRFCPKISQRKPCLYHPQIQGFYEYHLKMLRNQSFVTPFLFRFHFVCCYTKLKKSFAHFCAKANLTDACQGIIAVFSLTEGILSTSLSPNLLHPMAAKYCQCDKEIVFIKRQGRQYMNSTVADKFHCVPAYNNYTGYAFLMVLAIFPTKLIKLLPTFRTNNAVLLVVEANMAVPEKAL